MINNSILNIGNQRIYIYNLLSIILIALLFATSSLANEDSKKCVVYRNGQLVYNPDNPKIHCTTLQILDNFWDDNNKNVPNPNKKPEDFTEILTLKDITSNGNIVCKNPSTPNATFTTKDALEGEIIFGTCNTGYTGTITATCNKNGSWDFSNKCFSDCNNLEDMYADSSLINTIKTISNDEFAYSKCDIGYDGYKKHKCENGKIETTNVCSIIKCNNLVNMYKENTFTNEAVSINHGEFVYEKCGVGYEGHKEYTCNAGTMEISNDACEIISGCTEFAFHLDEQYLDVPSTGLANLKVQVWGAQGGLQWSTSKNFGGYGYGEITSVNANTHIRVRTGQFGGNIAQIGREPIGSGNGGPVTNKCYGDTTRARAGGGGTKVWFNDASTNEFYQLQAGGGGGDADGENNVGAAGGGANKDGDSTQLATGGTTNSHGNSCDGQTATRTSNENGDPNTTNHSNNNMSCGGGGGGGYYGGGSCGYAVKNGKAHTAGGAGGSGYATKNFKNIDGKNGVKTKNGFVRICWGNDTHCNGGSTEPTESVCNVTYSNNFSNAIEIHYGEGAVNWKPGFFKYGSKGTCANNKGKNNNGNWGNPSPNVKKACYSPNGFFHYADQNGTFTAL